MSRFSKQAMLEYLQARAKVLKDHHGFVSTDGAAQVKRAKYSSNESYIQALVDYGQYRAMLDLQFDVIEERIGNDQLHRTHTRTSSRARRSHKQALP